MLKSITKATKARPVLGILPNWPRPPSPQGWHALRPQAPALPL